MGVDQDPMVHYRIWNGTVGDNVAEVMQWKIQKVPGNGIDMPEKSAGLLFIISRIDDDPKGLPGEPLAHDFDDCVGVGQTRGLSVKYNDIIGGKQVKLEHDFRDPSASI